jgi:hypothetical protein
MVMREHEIPIDEIYIPTKRRGTVDPQRVDALAQDILEKGQQNRSGFVGTTNVMSSSRACIDWKLARRSGNGPSWPCSCRPANSDQPTGELKVGFSVARAVGDFNWQCLYDCGVRAVG